MQGRPVAFLLAAILAASCDAKSPLASTPPAPRVDLQFGRGFGSVVDLLNGTPVMVASFRPLSMEAGLVPPAAGHEISYSAWVVTGGSTHTTLDPNAVQWSS